MANYTFCFFYLKKIAFSDIMLNLELYFNII